MKLKLNLIFSSVFLILIFLTLFFSSGIFVKQAFAQTCWVDVWSTCVNNDQICIHDPAEVCPDGGCSCRSNDKCKPGNHQYGCGSGGNDNQTPIGWHDGYSGDQPAATCVAAGWTTDPDDKNIDLKVKVLVDGNQFGGAANEYTASAQRNDLLNICPGGTCSYYIPLTGITGSHTIKVQAKDAQTGTWHDLSGTPKTINCAAAPVSTPAYCQSAAVSKTSLNQNESLTITSTANTDKIKTFAYVFYNLDNLFGPNNPKGICFEAAGQAAAGTCPVNSKEYIKSVDANPTANSKTVTVSYADLDKIDKATGQKPTKIQVNAYFVDDQNRVSASNPACVVQFQVNVPTATCTGFAKKSQGDANGDGLINDADYDLWKTDFLAGATGCKATDFNSDNKVDIMDFEIWRHNKYL